MPKKKSHSPAPSITLGFDVLVHDVIAAMMTEPCVMLYVLPSENVKSPDDDNWAGDRPYPLNPIWRQIR
ncbi:hypothetical protein O3G_MSEX001020 [Manduca sexta]|nr:hypothetical protein O3G_MSEX001020 [Manduca sexta]